MGARAHIAIVASVLVILAACGGSPTAESGAEGESETSETGFEEVLKQIEGLSGKERTDKLAELAAEEGGQLSLYTSMTSDVEDEIGGAFGDAYDIDVSVYRADSETVIQRLLQEADAGFSGADVAETNGPELFNLNESNVLVDYDSDLEADLVEGSEYEGWTADRFNKFVVSWNTDRVANGEQPKSWEELADPKWDGQLALEPTDIDWYKTLWEYWVNDQGMSEEEVDGIFEEMARNALFVKGHTLQGDMLTAGEFSVAASNYSYIVQNTIEEGAPVAWNPPVEPIISRPNGVGLVRGAQHPATALLFTDWILSDGQELLAEFNLDPARTDLATTAESEEIIVDLESLTAQQSEWEDRYDELVTLGRVIEE